MRRNMRRTCQDRHPRVAHEPPHLTPAAAEPVGTVHRPGPGLRRVWRHHRQFFQRRQLRPDPAASDGRGRDCHRPDPDHPDRRHRPVLRHADGTGQHRDDQVRGRSRHAHPAGGGLRRRRLRPVRPGQRAAGDAHQAAALHRHPGHLQHRLRDHPALLRRPDRVRSAREHDLAEQHLRHRHHLRGLRRGADDAALPGHLVLAA